MNCLRWWQDPGRNIPTSFTATLFLSPASCGAAAIQRRLLTARVRARTSRPRAEMDQLALVCEDIARHGSRLRKTAILAGYLSTLSDEDLALAVQFLSAGPVPENGPNHLLFDAEEKPKL